MIEYRRYDEVRTWHVVFDRPRSRRMRWWRLVTGRQFSHCWAFSEAGEGIIHLEPLHWGICCTYEPITVEQKCNALADNNVTAILSCTIDYRASADYSPRGLYNCVSIIKALLGVKGARTVLTPFQLYKYLIHNLEMCIILKPWIPYMGVGYGNSSCSSGERLSQ